MATIKDPDLLDRNEVLFGTVLASRKISYYPVGATRSAEKTDGATAAADILNSASATFITDGVAAGDIVCLKDKDHTGHYRVRTIPLQTQLTLDLLDAKGASAGAASFGAVTGITFIVKQAATTAIIADGLTGQALYSYEKEEWRNDLANIGADDLIRHHFPHESITEEEFEVGGGAKHADWDYFNEFTKKQIRNAGWTAKNTAETVIQKALGVVSLGALDTDTQAYFQQINATSAPVNFNFTGPINEFVDITQAGEETFLTLRARKKKRTYAEATFANAGVTSARPKVEKFPLSHSNDPAIVANDGEVTGNPPFRNQRTLSSAMSVTLADVDTVTGTVTRAAGSFTTDGVVAGDTINVTAATNTANVTYFEILTVDSATVVTVKTPDAALIGEAGATADATTNIRRASKSTAGASNGIIDVDGATGTLTDVTGVDFTAAPAVAIGDMVKITTSAGSNGIYKVTAVAATVLTLNTSDRNFPAALEATPTYEVRLAGMHLEFKETTLATLTSTEHTTLAFASGGQTITRVAGSWITDGYDKAGSIVTITGTASNNSSFVVVSATATVLTVLAGVVTEAANASAVANGFVPFARAIGSSTFGFNWRLFGNGAVASKCFEFIQHQLRLSMAIDAAAGAATTKNPGRGDITGLLMTFVSPNGVGKNMFIDDLAVADKNNVTYDDALPTPVNRSFPFSSGVTISFDQNFIDDAAPAKFFMFFTNDDAGDNTGRDYGTPTAILVQDDLAANVTGDKNSAGFSIPNKEFQFSYDYDGNTQRGAASAGTDAPVTVVAIGHDKAKFGLGTGTIKRQATNPISVSTELDRNYSNTA